MKNLTQNFSLIIFSALGFLGYCQDTIPGSAYSFNPGAIISNNYSTITPDYTAYSSVSPWNNNIANFNPGNNYGCLGTANGIVDNYPIWVYLKCDQPGNLDFVISDWIQ